MTDRGRARPVADVDPTDPQVVADPYPHVDFGPTLVLRGYEAVPATATGRKD
jgi:hypothetical protein